MVKLRFIAVFFMALLMAGCASTGSSHKLVSSPQSSTKSISKYTDLIITVQPDGNVPISQAHADRLSQLIGEDIKAEAPDKFRTINLPSPGVNTLQALVKIKEYDEGNALARAMLAGLGQIHIEADLTLADFSTKEHIAQYEISKTFAWGGLYGAGTGIKDVEVGFCKAVANAITSHD